MPPVRSQIVLLLLFKNNTEAEKIQIIYHLELDPQHWFILDIHEQKKMNHYFQSHDAVFIRVMNPVKKGLKVI